MAFPAFTISLVGLTALCLTAGFAAASVFNGATEPPTAAKESFPKNCTFAAVPAATRQILVVAGKSRHAVEVLVYLLAREGAGWSVSTPPIPAVVGRKGFAPPDAKREGDGRTPSGVYPLEFVFGYAPKADTRMPYRQADTHDVWVDDAASDDYNQWVRRNDTAASSFEELRRKDDLYKYGLVVGYNRQPIARGLGSAIFVHLWRRPGEPTSGCVAVAEHDMLRILKWLDPDQHPLIILGTESTISAEMK